jgi:UDP-GlcNAc:undecaprenyl-phosphate GlcNAc-1-phosphate transferase
MLSPSVREVLALLVGAGATVVGVVVLLRAPGPVAQPVPDRWHGKATPLTGGLALLSGFLIALSIAEAAGEGGSRAGYLAAGATAAFLVGLADDERWIGPRAKFAGQLAIGGAAAAVIRPHWLPPAAAVAVTVLVLVAAMNSFNLLDNIDGLAAGTAALAAGTLAVSTLFVGGASTRLVACAVAGACAGFLPFNYRRRRPAALFMGDSGAHFLGFAVGGAALTASPDGAGGVAVTVVAPLLILALPIMDTSLVIVVRLAEGRPVWRGGRDHLSHRLVYVGLGEREAVAVLLLLAAGCAGAGLLIVAFDDALVAGAASGVVIALLIGIGSRLALVREPSTVMERAAPPQERRLEPVREHAHAN